jgi:uncharacterized protein with HEPN domain
MSKDSKLYVVQILDEIKFLESIPEQMNFESFVVDPALPRAVSFSLQIISEASRKISPDWLGELPHIEWHKIRALGNRTRHEYAGLQMSSFWQIIIEKLPELKLAMHTLMEKPDYPLLP